MSEPRSGALSLNRHDAFSLAAFWVGTASIILGGLVAAVTSPLGWSKGSWAAAYLVLVGGVVQVLFAWAHSHLARPGAAGGFWLAFACWNAGNAAVVGGTLAHAPIVVGIASALLVVALVQQLWQVRGAAGSPTWRLAVYRAVMIVLLVSIPVGVFLSAVRAG